MHNTLNNYGYERRRFMNHVNRKLNLKIFLLFLVFFLLVGCQQKIVKTSNKKNTSVLDDQILHVDISNDENAISGIYLMNEENEFSSTFISKYDIGTHSTSYKIIIKSEYQDRIDYLEMDMPATSTITSLYITMDNYNFIVGLFDGTELTSKQTLDINQYNQESENFVCKSSTNNKITPVGLSQKLDNDLVIYDTTLVMVHGDEQWNEDNEEHIKLSVILEEQ